MEAWDLLRGAPRWPGVRRQRLGQSDGRGVVRRTQFWLRLGGRADAVC